MCQGHLRVDYSDEVSSSNYGLFGNSGPITIQAMITPYDVNGYGYTLDLDNPIGKFGITSSKKTLPALQSKAFNLVNVGGSTEAITTSYTQRNKYLSVSDALTHEMMIFYNTNIQLSLLNATSTNMNQPSEYKIKFTINADGTSDTLTTSSAVITADEVLTDVNRYYGYDGANGGARYFLFGTIGAITTSVDMGSGTVANSAFACVSPIGATMDEDEFFNIGEKLYTESNQVFTHIGTVHSVSGSGSSMQVNVLLESGKTLTASAEIFKEVDKEASYLVTPYHISASYDNSTGLMNIYLNGGRVASKFHSSGSSAFTVEPEDCYIGVSTDDISTTAVARKQFMGELHELAVLKGNVNSFVSINTLLPNYRNLLLYYRFEEVDE